MTKRGAVWPEITSRIKRAARNGERLHLEPRLVRAIYASEVWIALCRLEQAEVIASWTDEERASAGLGLDEG